MRKSLSVALCGVVAPTVFATSAHAAVAVANSPRLQANGTISATGWASSNWSGYAITGGPFTSVTGSWVVPAVAKTRHATYSSSWAGIDGFNNSNLIQAGTEQDYYRGSAHLFAWG